MRLAIIESPYAGHGATPSVRALKTARNVDYARACVRDSLMRGEAPIASHLLYTQTGILDDLVAKERRLGMDAGYAWMKAVAKIPVGASSLEPIVLFYTDLGRSNGMEEALDLAGRLHLELEERRIGSLWFDTEVAEQHANLIAQAEIEDRRAAGG